MRMRSGEVAFATVQIVHIFLVQGYSKYNWLARLRPDLEDARRYGRQTIYRYDE